MKALFFLLIRKIRSSIIFSIQFFLNSYRYSCLLLNPSLSIGTGCKFGNCILIQATDGGSINIGNNVSFSNCVQIIAQGGCVTISEDVFIGVGCMIICKESIVIGKDTQIAEYVVIRDQDHRTDSRPIKDSGFHISPIHIGSDVWIGCKASILRGSTVGDRSVIGAHALVRSHIDQDVLAVGVPARAVKYIGLYF